MQDLEKEYQHFVRHAFKKVHSCRFARSEVPKDIIQLSANINTDEDLQISRVLFSLLKKKHFKKTSGSSTYVADMTDQLAKYIAGFIYAAGKTFAVSN